MTRKQRRLSMIGGAGAVLAVAGGLILYALNDEIVFFQSPSDVAEHNVPHGQRIRLGGLVKDGSIVKYGETVRFVVTDGGGDLTAIYTGTLPDLFREGQGVVAEGKVGDDGIFHADTVLAKHDENYIPKEVVEALKERGEWQMGADNPKAKGAPAPDKASRAEPQDAAVKLTN
ncbi:cytochrome c maturation protein CcmE [Breoghania sp.]|uniref:cytochrome c maturation protein CcmE n=1 Tax=Breoghania sp. TaxID=2065378 RepID=UPI002612920B|nr:cytochrome c maturation protein CcmE [Breoghania sp.]MDJ0931853.1 cytochrome c maturation protein CcmE [Breoghania sp.]